MAKSQIIKDLVNKRIELTQALERVLIIAMEINDIDTIKWIKCEKNGYSSDDIVPKYRNVSLRPIGTYRIYGDDNIFENHQLPTIGVPEDLKAYIECHQFRNGISQIIEQYSEYKDKNVSLNIPIPPELFGFFEKGTNINITSAKMTISPFDLERIIDAVRTRTIELLVLLEKNFGNLDDLDINLDDYKKEEIEKLQEACSVVIKGDNNGDTYIITESKIKKSNIGKGNSSNKDSKVEFNVNLPFDNKSKKSILKRIIEFFGGKENG